MTNTLSILLVEDDNENLELMMESLPTELEGFNLVWDPCNDFDEALRKLDAFRYDLVVSDVYRDRADRQKGTLAEDERVPDIVARLREKRFCPIVIFSDGSIPANVVTGPFVRFADKSSGDTHITSEVANVIRTQIPRIARLLHEELDKSAGSYLWQFLEEHWEKLGSSKLLQDNVLERLIRRRAAVQLGRLDECSREIKSVEGAEFYIYPPIAEDVWRMGEIIRESNGFRVILTPHCHLQPQPNDSAPRAEFVLTVKTVVASELFEKNPVQAQKAAKILDEIRRRIQSPASVGKPGGRYWFLPGFLEMPDLYCDFMQLESVPLDDLGKRFTRFAVLDVPFAEAMQSCFAGFYSAVGLPALNPERFTALVKGV